MKTTVVSYSLTGNNDRLAGSLAAARGAEHMKVAERARRTMGTIALDNMLNRTPKVALPALKPEERDLVVFVSPVWMGQVASPLRACFREFGPRLGKEPPALVELHKADFLPPEPKPTRDDTMKHRISETKDGQLTERAVAELRRTIAG